MANYRHWKLWVWVANNDGGVDTIDTLLDSKSIFALTPAAAQARAISEATEMNIAMGSPYLLSELSYSFTEIIDVS